MNALNAARPATPCISTSIEAIDLVNARMTQALALLDLLESHLLDLTTDDTGMTEFEVKRTASSLWGIKALFEQAERTLAEGRIQ